MTAPPDHRAAARRPILVALAVFPLLAVLMWGMGRSPLGPDGTFGWWTSNIWGPQCSQRLADAYAFSHIIHGMAFYGLLWIFARRLSVPARYLIAVILEAGWELLENSPVIINRYRDATMALGYSGDSILNSTGDLLMMSLGFFLAWRLPVWLTVLAVLVMEIACALWIRDNLTLNLIMLIHPVEAIKAWQMAGAPAA